METNRGITLASARLLTLIIAIAPLAVLPSCGFWRTGTSNEAVLEGRGPTQNQRLQASDGSRLFDGFRGDGAAGVRVNRFLWTASLEVLDFLPISTADPFTGVISTGFGTPPGGGRAYRATVLISDPALDARSLNVAIQSRNGPVATGTQRAVEDAILTRARQLRSQAENF
ncbi:MAG: DUF3576 domain-containing protein [Pseudomonadota bacterium]